MSLALLAATAFLQTLPDPTHVQLVFDDVDRFYQVLESTKDEDLDKRLTEDYLKKGTPGLKYFWLSKIKASALLSSYAKKHRGELLAHKDRIYSIKKAEPRIRAAFCAFKYFCPDAKFPPIVLVVGRESAGGTANNDSLILGAEMSVNDPARIHEIITHELVHFNQKVSTNGLRGSTVGEGMADFIGEMCSGGFINDSIHPYGNAHEKELWVQWNEEVNGKNRILDWTGSYSQTKPRPGDLGYYVGYRICQSYYNQATDKRKAIQDMLEMTDAKKFVQDSGYNP